MSSGPRLPSRAWHSSTCAPTRCSLTSCWTSCQPHQPTMAASTPTCSWLLSGETSTRHSHSPSSPQQMSTMGWSPLHSRHPAQQTLEPAAAAASNIISIGRPCCLSTGAQWIVDNDSQAGLLIGDAVAGTHSSDCLLALCLCSLLHALLMLERSQRCLYVLCCIVFLVLGLPAEPL